MNLRNICINAAQKALKESKCPNASDVKAIKETIRKYAPNWGELLGLNKEYPLDEAMINLLNHYFIIVVFVLERAAQEFEKHLKTKYDPHSYCQMAAAKWRGFGNSPRAAIDAAMHKSD